ncbi:MAG: tyrosine-type recombinase/integrase [Verrucomicrobiales bacterium]|nr:tyrosine-type recombinase/integrase [Verrucomicrobiales bacterium]
MKARFRLFIRGARGGVFYCVDSQTGRRASLKTTDRRTAETLIHARNEAERQPQLNLRIAQTYLTATDGQAAKRTWGDVMREMISLRRGANRARYERGAGEHAFDPLRDRPLIETQAEHLLAVLRSGSVSTNLFLRRFHNFALGMNWIPWPVLPKKLWPTVQHGERRSITRTEHAAILGREPDPELRAFYACCWYLGGSQTDVARLRAEDVDWPNRVVSFFRSKTGTVQIVRFGEGLAAVLNDRPKQGALFRRLMGMDEKHRAALFQRILRRLGIRGVSLHSYRYAWAERAKTAGYPERFAQEALGHNSKAVHRAYARKAQVTLPSLEEFEKQAEQGQVLKATFGAATVAAKGAGTTAAASSETDSARSGMGAVGRA